MHDCRKSERKLVDLVFDSLQMDEKRSLMAELESCEMCLSAYRAMEDSLYVFDQGVEASMPDESFWPRHHESLRRRIAQEAHAFYSTRVPLWRRLFTFKVSLPLPVATVAALALMFFSVLALRPSSATNIEMQAPRLVSESSVRTVEVPIIQERVVLRIVYVGRNARRHDAARRTTPVTPGTGRGLTAQRNGQESGQGGLFTRANLTDFQPPDEMRIRIVKRSGSDEN